MAKESPPAGSAAQPLVLTNDELTALTGTMQAKRQARWLDERSWVYEPPAPGRRKEHPKVDRTYYLARMSGQHQVDAPRAKPRLGHFGKA